MSVLSVVILNEDRLHAYVFSQMIASLLPDARCVAITTVPEARKCLSTSTVDLLLTGIGSPQDDVLELIEECTRHPVRAHRVVVVTTYRDSRLLSCLRRMSICGVFDPAADSPGELHSALQTILRGQTYWSRSMLEALRAERMAENSVERLLTATEQLVFAVIGDGTEDAAAAELLGFKPSYVQSVRRELHRKLGLHHRGELIRKAISSGYVRITSEGTVRPGFSQLLAGRGAQVDSSCRHRAA